MRVRHFAIALSVAVIAVCLATPILAQTIFGTILGTVTDPSGAVMPNLVVTVTNQGENISREVRSDAQGNYQAENLKAGLYTVRVQAAGFKEVVLTDVLLTARQTVRVDLSLVMGGTEEKVTVEARAELINTESPTISASFTSAEVLALPANYRGAGSTSPYALLAYLPGVQADQFGNISVQGAQVNQVEYTVDGISTASVRYSGPQREMFPSAENISEMKVQGVENGAEYGQVGDITTTSKGGTNVFHGSAFDYLQNAALDSAAFGSFAGKPAKSANTFGGSLGGPIFKNHTFFFVDYEGMRYRTGETLHETVPTDAMWNGDFTGVADIHDFDGSAFPTPNQVPTDRINPAVAIIRPYYPLPNHGGVDVFQQDNYVVNVPNPITSDQFDVRIDHTINSKQSVFGRVTHKSSYITCASSCYQVLLLPPEADFDRQTQVVVAHSFAITPNLVNELRGGVSRGRSGGDFPVDGPALMEQLGFNGLGPFPQGGFPDFEFYGGSGITFIGHQRPNPLLSSNFQINENLTWTKGKHTMKFGFDWRKLRLTNAWYSTYADDYGDYYFNAQYTGHDFSDFLLGAPYFTYVTHTAPDIDGQSNHYYGYAQDTFKVTPKLTLDFGVRFSRLSPFIDPINHTNFDPSVPVTGKVVISSDPRSVKLTNPLWAAAINACGSINPFPTPGVPCTPIVTAQENHWPEGLRKTYSSFAPRVGFAYRPFASNETVLRGGIGLYTVTTLGTVFYSVAGIHDGYQASFYNTQDSTTGAPGFQFPDVQVGDPQLPQLGTQRFETSNQFAKKDPYVIQWNLTGERTLHGNTALRLSYIGSRGVQLTWGPDINQALPSTTPFDQFTTPRPFPNWANIYSRAGGGTSSYHAMQTELIHKYSSGLSFQSTWTWAHNLTDVESYSGSGFSGEVTDRAMNTYNIRGDWGNVGGTRRHRWITTMVYELPIGKGRRLLGNANGVLNGFIGGWRMSTIALVQSGPFLTPVSFRDTTGTGQGRNRPDVFGDANIDNPTPSNWWNHDMFACPGEPAGVFGCGDDPPIARFGNARVGSLIGPGTVNLSLGLAKNFRLTERVSLKFESSFTNLPNHVNFDDPNTDIGSDRFGKTFTARGGDSGGNRIGQFAVRIEF